MRYQGPAPQSDQPACTGILLTNLGTPDAPTTTDVRRYLKEFLSDPRVVELPRLLWWLILNGVILRTRPKRSAAAYRQVWTEAGSPLMDISLRQAAKLQAQLNQTVDQPCKVVLAMRYGNPSIEEGLEALRQANAQKVIALPLYPQYSATTTASTFDAISAVFQRWRWLPELSFINSYHDHPDYIAALKTSVLRHWENEQQPDKLLLSFHGIPQDYADGGDPYPQQCLATAHALADALELTDNQWHCCFQSRLGNKEWIKPYTDLTLKQWGSDGVESVQVLCPGFSADCLETIEEIGEENRDYFLESGGKHYQYIPALNDDSEHIDLMVKLIQRRL
ncbi:MAG: ferrochelatase [Chromatiales bacterium]|nr:ferrochelatase [Chromatiales bacterium]